MIRDSSDGRRPEDSEMEFGHVETQTIDLNTKTTSNSPSPVLSDQTKCTLF